MAIYHYIKGSEIIGLEPENIKEKLQLELYRLKKKVKKKKMYFIKPANGTVEEMICKLKEIEQRKQDSA